MSEPTRAPVLMDVKFVAGLAALIASAAIVLNVTRGDVDRGRAVFSGLVYGRQNVQRDIEWEHLRGLDVDVGQAYRALPSDKERTGYRRAFVENFAKGFAIAHAKVSDFVNWRIAQRSPETVSVAADYRGKGRTLLVMLNASTKHLVSLQWQ